MNLKSVAAFIVLFLPVSDVFASPITNTSSEVVYLYARAFTLNVVPAAIGDFAKISRPRPKNEPEPSKGACPNYKKALSDWKKNTKACNTWDTMQNEFKTAVVPAVTRTLQAAEAALHLTGLHVVAEVRSNLHINEATDPLPRWTFSFAAPVCGANPGDVCTGHAYDPTGAPIGWIWNAKHAELFHK